MNRILLALILMSNLAYAGDASGKYDRWNRKPAKPAPAVTPKSFSGGWSPDYSGSAPPNVSNATGTLPATNGGTGVSNAGTLTNASNTAITGGGTIALGGFTLTAPATGTVGLRGSANTWTAQNVFEVGAAGAAPLIARQTGGTASVDEVQFYHTGDHAYIDAKSGVLFVGHSAGTGTTAIGPHGGFGLLVSESLISLNQPVASPTYYQFTEMAAPSAGAANTVRFFARDNGAGKTQFCVLFNDGVVQVLATEP